MARMTDDEIQRKFDDYNRLRAKESYWVGAGMALVEYLHKTHGMRYSDIYAIAEDKDYVKSAKAALAVIRMENNVTPFRHNEDSEYFRGRAAEYKD